MEETPPKECSLDLFKSFGKEISISFGKTFLLYAIPMSILRRKVKAAVFRRATALACFIGIVKAYHLLLSHQKNRTLQYYSKALGGATGAGVALYIDKDLGYSTVVTWFVLRAIRCLMDDFQISRTIANLPYLPTAIMCLSASQILSCWVRYPSELDQNYRKFLDSQGGRPRWVLQLAAAPNTPFPFPFAAIRKPGTGLYSDAFYFFLSGMKRAVKLYIPLYIAMFLYSASKRHNRSLTRLQMLLQVFLTNISRSSLFLSIYCTMSWFWYPFIGQFFSNPAPMGATRVLLRRNGWPAGLAVLIERKERRSMLAMYCATYAIDSIWRRMEMNVPFVAAIQPVFAAVFMILSCSILLHHDDKQPDILTKWILGFPEKKENK